MYLNGFVPLFLWGTLLLVIAIPTCARIGLWIPRPFVQVCFYAFPVCGTLALAITAFYMLELMKIAALLAACAICMLGGAGCCYWFQRRSP